MLSQFSTPSWELSHELFLIFILPCQDPVTKNDQLRRIGDVKEAKAKAKAQGKSKAKARAKAKAAPKAKARAKAKAKAKAKAGAKAGARPPRGYGRRGEPLLTIDDVLEEHPGVEPADAPIMPPSPSHGRRPAMKRPAAASAKDKEKKKPRVETTDGLSEHVKEMLEQDRVPHTFGGRGCPAKGWGLEKYCLVADAFESHVAPSLPARKNTRLRQPLAKPALVLNTFAQSGGTCLSNGLPLFLGDRCWFDC